jgi:hypothetical protein
MTNVKRRPGRPTGTDYKEDLTALELVADRMIAHPDLKAMTAMKAVYDSKRWKGRGGAQRDTTVARWLKKWQIHGEAALTAARKRARRVMSESPPRTAAAWPEGGSFAAVRAAVQGFTPSPELIRSLKGGAEAIRHFEAHSLPVMEAMAKLAGQSAALRSAYPQLPAMPSYAQSFAAIAPIPKLPKEVIEQFEQMRNSPAVAILRDLMKNHKRS